MTRHTPPKSKRTGFEPITLIRWVGLIVMALILIAVGAGYTGQPVLTSLAGILAWIHPIVKPLWWGLSLLEIIAIAVIISWLTYTLKRK